MNLWFIELLDAAKNYSLFITRRQPKRKRNNSRTSLIVLLTSHCVAFYLFYIVHRFSHFYICRFSDSKCSSQVIQFNINISSNVRMFLLFVKLDIPGVSEIEKTC